MYLMYVYIFLNNAFSGGQNTTAKKILLLPTAILIFTASHQSLLKVSFVFPLTHKTFYWLLRPPQKRLNSGAHPNRRPPLKPLPTRSIPSTSGGHPDRR